MMDSDWHVTSCCMLWYWNWTLTCIRLHLTVVISNTRCHNRPPHYFSSYSAHPGPKCRVRNDISLRFPRLLPARNTTRSRRIIHVLLSGVGASDEASCGLRFKYFLNWQLNLSRTEYSVSSYHFQRRPSVNMQDPLPDQEVRRNNFGWLRRGCLCNGRVKTSKALGSS